MKKIKILGIAVATLGVAASIGGAIALYVRPASDAGFGIGAGTYSGSTGVVTYKVNNAVAGEVAPEYVLHGDENKQAIVGATGLKIYEENNVKKYYDLRYKFPLSADFANDLPHQNFVLGKVTVSVGEVPAALLGKYKVSVYIGGYGANTFGELKFKQINYDYAFTNENKTYAGAAHVSVASAGTQWLELYFEITDTTGLDMLTLNELALPSVSMTWGEKDSDYDVAYVVGNGNLWTQDDEFSMAIDVNASTADYNNDNNKWPWIYNNLSGALAHAKCNHGNGTWSQNTAEEDGNTTLDPAKTYTVRWAGTGSDQAVFTEVTA